ncbi:hypothetical protein VNO78_24839 [Psophocarpus tetragonolobus]|uniref:Uncharacterized protein n=1 Tax=Psophocarpus tetragonolobus TaxID=3891 RepID=A0AAN9S8K3_PSOTE
MRWDDPQSQKMGLKESHIETTAFPGRWLKSLISLRKPFTTDQEKGGDKSKRKWKLWRSSLEGFGIGSSMQKGQIGGGGGSFVVDDGAFAAALAAVVRTPLKDFMVIKQEWAAIRIQAVFREESSILLVIRSDGGKTSVEGPKGSVTAKEVKAKLQTRQEGAVKRDRAKRTGNASPNSRAAKSVIPLKNRNLDSKRSGWSMLDRWMAARPWESRSMVEMYLDSPDTTLVASKSDNLVLPFKSDKQTGSVKARRNGVTTRISTKSLTTSQSTPSSSAISSECMYDDSPMSTSCASRSPSRPSSNNVLVKAADERNVCKPSYMNLTASTKAKLKSYRCFSQNSKRNFMDDCVSLSGVTRSSSGSNPCANTWKNLYATPLRTSYHKRFSLENK